jgi:GNAT superfamily N-acetyltransferase
MLTLARNTSENPDFRALVRQLDRYLAELDGAEHGFYAQFNKIDLIRHAVVAYADGQPVGCGAFKELEPGVVEIKRMYVAEAHQRQGIAQAVLGELEAWAAELGYAIAVLETGRRQPEAIALYQRGGYQLTANYGQYVGVANSVCLRKPLGQ